MTFEVFDRKTENEKRKYGLPVIKFSVKRRRMYLNRNASALLDVENKKFAKFLKNGRSWYIALTNDKSGYAVIPYSPPRVGSSISAAIVFDEIMNKSSKDACFYIHPTHHELGGCKVFELVKANA